eukprot:Clim_evm10s25 gene=Clim_evmTU10s25
MSATTNTSTAAITPYDRCNYETRYFKVHPAHLTGTLCQAYQDIAWEAIASLKAALCSELEDRQGSRFDRHGVEKAVNAFYKDVQDHWNYHLDVYEFNVMNHCFRIPDSVALPDDSAADVPAISHDDEAEMDAYVRQCEAKVAAQQDLLRVRKEEMNAVAKVNEIIAWNLQFLDVMNQQNEEGGDGDEEANKTQLTDMTNKLTELLRGFERDTWTFFTKNDLPTKKNKDSQDVAAGAPDSSDAMDVDKQKKDAVLLYNRLEDLKALYKMS